MPNPPQQRQMGPMRKSIRTGHRCGVCETSRRRSKWSNLLSDDPRNGVDTAPSAGVQGPSRLIWCIVVGAVSRLCAACWWHSCQRAGRGVLGLKPQRNDFGRGIGSGPVRIPDTGKLASCNHSSKCCVTSGANGTEIVTLGTLGSSTPEYDAPAPHVS